MEEGGRAIPHDVTTSTRDLIDVIVKRFAELLGLDIVGVDDDFFVCGGHSLLAAQLIAELSAELGVDLDVSILFDHPTPTELNDAINDVTGATPSGPRRLQVRRTEGTEGPPSFSQSRLWMLQQIVGQTPFYNVPVGFRMRGPLRVDALAAALTEIVDRHHALRTTFGVAGIEPCQRVHPTEPVALPIVDVSHESDPFARANELRVAEAAREFDLDNGPLVRAQLYRLDPDDHVLALTLHHIVCDGTSIGVLVDELTTLYRAFAAGAPSPLEPLPAQYLDFAIAQRDWLADPEFDEELDYWRAQLDGAACLELYTNYPRDARTTFEGAQVHFAVPDQTVARLRELCAAEGATMFMALLANFAALLARYGDHDDVCLGTPIANRTTPEVQRLIGFFVNTIVMRVDCSGDPTFHELIRRTRDVAIEGYAHQNLPFERLVEELEPRRISGRNPFFQIHFQLVRMPLADIEVDDEITATFVEGTTGVNPIDLLMHFFEGPTGIEGWLEYATDLFDGARVETMVEDLLRFMSMWSTHPELQLHDVPIAGTRSRLSGQPRPRRAGAPLLHAIAPACGHEAIEDVSYATLHERADAFATAFAARGVGPGTCVVLALPPSADYVAAALGALQRGAAVVPIDANGDESWHASVIADCNPAVVFTEAHLQQLLDDHDHIHRVTPADPIDVDPASTAVLVYTTRGRIELSHALLSTRLDDRLHAFPIDANDSVLWHAPPTSHSWAWEVFGTLRAGARIVLPHDRTLLATLRAERVSVAHLSAPHLAAIVFEETLADCEALRLVHCEGDSLPHVVLDAAAEQTSAQFVYGYGTLNDGGLVIAATCDPSDPHLVAAGRPIGASTVEVVDQFGELRPRGLEGLLVVNGHATAHPAVMHDDGTLQLLPLSTGVVEVDASPLDLYECERVLAAHPDVDDCAVVCYDLETGDRRLVGYFTAHSDATVDVSLEIERVAAWQRAFDSAYGAAEYVADANITGWNVRLEGARAVRMVMSPPVPTFATGDAAAARVLELGCGPGANVWSLAPLAAEYVACDFSRPALDLLEAENKRRGWKHVTVLHREADDFAGIASGAFDLVLAHGLLPYLPSRAYLDRVVAGCIETAAPSGRIVFGAVLDLDAQEANEELAALGRRGSRTTTLGPTRADPTRFAIRRRYFTDLPTRFERVARVEIIPTSSTDPGADFDVIVYMRAEASNASVPAGDPSAPDSTSAPLARATSQRHQVRVAGELARALQAHVQSQPIAAEVIGLDRIPRSRNGAVVRALLPRPKGLRPSLQTPFVAPNTPIERRVADAWCDALALTRVGVNDNFFALGGDSILALQVAAQLRGAGENNVDPGLVFKASTIAEIVALLEAEGWTPREEDA